MSTDKSLSHSQQLHLVSDELAAKNLKGSDNPIRHDLDQSSATYHSANDVLTLLLVKLLLLLALDRSSFEVGCQVAYQSTTQASNNCFQQWRSTAKNDQTHAYAAHAFTPILSRAVEIVVATVMYLQYVNSLCRAASSC